MAATTKHPDASLLEAYALGKVSPPASDTLAVHLETCVDCRRVVAAAPADPFLQGLRDATLSDATMVETDEPIPPALLNSPDYEVVHRIKGGGMGVVYLVRHRGLGRLEALKVIHPAKAARHSIRERFEREMRVAASLKHRNIVTIYTIPRLEGLVAFTMEYIDGVDLHELVQRQGQLPISTASFYVCQAAQGLQHAHEHGMVHRDIKPGNLTLAIEGQDRVIKILDFGLAKAASEAAVDGGLTGSEVVGSPQYIAPEQIRNAAVADIRADIYGLGCTLYYLLAGEPPYAAKPSVIDVLDAHRFEAARPLNDVRPDVPVELAQIVAKMMAKDPALRYQQPREVAAALDPFVKGESDEPLKTDLGSFAIEPARDRETAAVWGLTAGVTAIDPGAVQAPAQSKSTDTDPHLSSAFSGTACDLPRVPEVAPSAEPRGAGSRSRDSSGDGPRARARLRVAFAGAAAVVLLGVVIVVKMRDGSTRRFEIKDDVDTVTITHDGAANAASPAADPNTELVKWALSVGGKVEVFNQERWASGQAMNDVSNIPDKFFGMMINLSDCKTVSDADLKRFKSLNKPFWLTLDRTRITDAGLKELRGLPSLQILLLEETAITRLGVENLGVLPNLDTISLFGTATTGKDLSLLTRFPKLTGVRLGRAQLTDEGVKSLSTQQNIIGLQTRDGVGANEFDGIGNLSQICSLSAVGKSCTDNCLEPLSKLTKLTGLGLYWTSVTDAGLARLPVVAPGLTLLNFAGEQMTDATVNHIAALRQLKSVSFQGTRVTAAGVAELQAALPDCKITWSEGSVAPPDEGEPNREMVKWVLSIGGKIDIFETATWEAGQPIDDVSTMPDAFNGLKINLSSCRTLANTDLKRLRSLTKPFWLVLDGTSITDAGLAELHSLSHLRDLSLFDTAITGVGIGNLGPLPNLESIELGGSATTGADLALLSRFPKLHTVRLGRAQLTDEGVKVLSTLKNIVSMNTIDDVGLDELVRIGNLSQLRQVSVLGKSCNDACLEPLANLTNLTVLGLFWTSVTDAGLARLSVIAPQLVGLNVCVGDVTDAAAKHLAALPQLKAVSLYQTRITAAGVAELQAALPDCKITWSEGNGARPAIEEADRDVLKWVLAVGGKVEVIETESWGPPKPIEDLSHIPDAFFGFTINLFDCQTLADADLKRFRSLTRPFSLTLDRTSVTDTGLAELHGLAHLRILNVNQTAITRAGIENLGILPSLEYIELGGTSTTGADLALLSRFPKLTSVRLGRAQLTDEGVAVLSALKNIVQLRTIDDVGIDEFNRIGNLNQVRYLSAVGKSCSDDCLEPLGRLKNLTTLNLYWTSVNDAGLARLPIVLPRLAGLTIAGAQVTNAAAKHLTALWKLETLNLEQTHITAVGVAELKAALPNCKINWTEGTGVPPATQVDREIAKWALDMGGRIWVGDGEVWGATKAIDDLSGLPDTFGSLAIGLSDCPKLTDADLKRFKTLTKPFGLSLDGTPVTDAGVAELNGLSNLRYLRASGTRVTRAGIEKLGVLPTLYEIGLVGTSTTDADLALLSRFPKLEIVALGQMHLTDRGVKLLSTLPNIIRLYADGAAEAESQRIGNLGRLRTFGAGGRQFNDACLEPLSKLTNLTALGLYNTSVADAGVAQLPLVAPRLDYLNLAGSRVGDKGLEKLAALAALEDLWVEGTEVTDDGLRHLRPLAKLKRLGLNDCRIGDAGLEKLAALPSLEAVHLRGTDVTDEGLRHLYQLANLKLLDLTNTRVTMAGVLKLKEALPNCTLQR